ncbi:MAG: hypothetical protein ABJG88_05750 [Litorimonas sp.]
MTDKLYPSVPDLAGHPAGFPHAQPAQIHNTTPNHPMPVLPQTIQPNPVRYDVNPLAAQVVDNNTPAFEAVPQPVPVQPETLLQDVMWPNAQPNGQEPNPAYPPMPPMPAMQPTGSPQAVAYPTPADDIVPPQTHGRRGLNPESLMSSVRQHLASKPMPEKPQTIANKVTADIVTDPTKPRSQRSVFLTGALCGAVISLVLASVIGNIGSRADSGALETVKAKNQPVAQVEKLDNIETPEGLEKLELESLEALEGLEKFKSVEKSNHDVSIVVHDNPLNTEYAGAIDIVQPQDIVGDTFLDEQF